MPDILTHVAGVENALKKIDTPWSRQILMETGPLRTGAQGPDIFFYYKVYPWKKDPENYRQLGYELHHKNTAKFLLTCLEHVKHQPSYEHRAFVLGFIGHYIIDTYCHPFIFYFSGGIDESIRAEKKFTYYHKSLEVTLDTLLSYYLKVDETHYHLMHPSKFCSTNLDRFVRESIERSHGRVLHTGTIQEAMTTMVNVLALLNGNGIVKNLSFLLIERLIGKPKAYSTALYPAIRINDKDYLNTKKKTWYHPVTGQPSNQSYLELFDAACDDLMNLYLKVYEYFDDKISLNDLAYEIQNMSYDTGLPVIDQRPMVYYDNIYLHRDNKPK